MRRFKVPLPPLAEQKRIVAKVVELMRFLDDLEAKQTTQRKTQARFRSAALDALASAEGPVELAAAWKRVAENFEVLFERSDAVDELRQAVIDLAFHGHLTINIHPDANVEDLLARIDADRKRHQGGKFTAELGIDGEPPYALPSSWRWVPWGRLTLETGSGWSPQCDNRPRADGEWGVLKVSAVSWFRFLPEENKALPRGLSPRVEFSVRAGDFLMSRANTAALVGRSVVVGDVDDRLILSDKIVRCVFSKYVEPSYVNLYNRSQVARSHYVTHASGTSDSMKNISREVILSMPVPLPPLEEQKRIVAKVEHLMKLCDDLEAKLRQADETAGKLVEAIVSELVAA